MLRSRWPSWRRPRSWTQPVGPVAGVRAAAGRGPAAATPAAEQAHFQEFRKAIAGKENLDGWTSAVAEALAPFEHRGLLGDPRKELDRANPAEILVYPVGHPELQEMVEVKDVQLGDGGAIRESLREPSSRRWWPNTSFTWFQAICSTPSP